MISNEQTVEVSFTKSSVVDVNDWIGVFTPSTSDDEDYLEFLYLSSFVGQKSGTVSFTLYNIRNDYQFRYFVNNARDGFNTQIGSSNVVQMANVNEPLHAHLSLTEKLNQMRIMWVTNTTEEPEVQWQEASKVKFGCSSGSVTSDWFKASATSDTYTNTMMCGSPANETQKFYGFIDPGQIHNGLMTDLKLNTLYCYRYGSSKTGWSTVRSFRSSPSNFYDDASTSKQSVSFVAFGDMGESPGDGAVSTIDHIRQLLPDIDLLLHIGDISYARGKASLWERFFNLIEPVASAIPYMVSIGNHEYDHETGGENDPSGAGLGFHPSWGNYGDDSHGECSVPMYHRFVMPSTGHSLYWYSFDYGFIHFVMISTEHDFTYQSEQYSWIASDLSSVNRTRTPWIIFTGHRPMYSSENYMADYNVSLAIRQYLEPLLFKYQVDVCLWAHYHSYERTCPVFQEKCLGTPESNPGGPIHMVIGMAGAALDFAEYMNKEWSVYHDQEYGYTLAQATPTNLTFLYYHNIDNKIYDRFTITK